jgi:hypothetical protein
MFCLFCVFIYSTVVCVSPLCNVAHILTLGSCAVTATVQSSACGVIDCLDTGIVGLNLTWNKTEFIVSEVTSHFKQARGHNCLCTNFHFQLIAQYLLFTSPTCSDHRIWPSSGSYTFHGHIQLNL